MRIEHLYYLIDIAKTKSITLSAEHLFISQQGLSQAIQKLEADLAVTLFRRCRQGVFLTDAGIVAAEKAEGIILKYEELLHSIEPYTETSGSTSTDKLLISVTPFISFFLPRILDLFRKKYPDVNIHIEEQKPDDIVTRISAGCVDLGLVNFPGYYCKDHLQDENVFFEKVVSHEYFACVAKSSPLAKKTMLSISEIKNQPIVVYNHEPYLEMLTHMLGDLSQLNIIVKTNSREIYMNTIIHSKAIGTVTPPDFNLFNGKPRVTIIPIKDSICIDFGWVISKKYPISSTVEKFLEIYRSYLTSEMNS